MPYTKSKLNKIMSKSGQAFVKSDQLNYAGRVCESLVRKLTYSWQDRASEADYQVIKALSDDIRRHGQDVAYSLGIDTLTNDSAGIQWRQRVLKYAEARIEQALSDIAFTAYQYAATAFAAGYYGRLWLMDSALHGRYPVSKPPVQPRKRDASILQPGITEAALPDYYTYQEMGNDWHEKYNNVAVQTVLKVRKSTSAALSTGATPNQALGGIAHELGADGKPGQVVGGTYHAAQLLTRAAVMRASNHGGVDAYREQETAQADSGTKWLLGAIWTTSNDSRVCDECDSHNGQVFIINDLIGILLLGLPPDGSHPGCRCSISPWMIPIPGEENTPPADTFDDWLLDNGYADELGAFIDDTELESTQV